MSVFVPPHLRQRDTTLGAEDTEIPMPYASLKVKGGRADRGWHTRRSNSAERRKRPALRRRRGRDALSLNRWGQPVYDFAASGR